MYYYWGMHGYWWIFWIFLWILFFSFLMPVRRTTYRQMQSPLQLLQRRYAAGEITGEEYEERRTKLLRDANMKPGLCTPSALRAPVSLGRCRP
jgi:putative membrane protein